MQCVVFVPGIMGSALYLDDRKVWPPSILELILGYGRIEELMHPDLMATELIERVGPVSVYRSMIEDLRRCGYVESGGERRLVVIPYDWRLSNAVTADAVADKISEVFDRENGLDRITLIGHSMGGLVLRYLVDSGRYADAPWFDAVTTLITLGTPHAGAPTALDRLRGEETVMGVAGADIRRLANDRRYPSLYQLVPPSGTGSIQLSAARGSVPQIGDALDPAVIERLELSTDNAAAANEFWEVLHRPTTAARIARYCVGGVSHRTTVGTVIHGGAVVPVWEDQSGDGTVPITSAILDGFPHSYSHKKHEKIFTDRGLRFLLYEILDAPADVRPHAAEGADDVAADVQAVGLSVDREVYVPGEPIELTLSYRLQAEDPSESIDIVRLTETGDDDGLVDSAGLRFQGMRLNYVTTSLSVDLEPGVYEIRTRRQLDDPEPTRFVVTRAT